MEIENNIESLLFSYLRGTPTDEETVEVERWMSVSPENRKIAEQLCVIDFANEAILCMRKAKPYQSLGEARQKIRKNKFRRVVAWTQRVAAVLFLPLLCLTVYHAQRTEKADSKREREQPQMIGMSSAPGVVTTVTLPDNTKVWLNANSYIDYPSYFEGDTREVFVAGEVYLSVAKNMEKPFYVNVNNAFKLKVTGTELNIEAYPTASTFSTTLIEGSVDIVSAANPAHSFMTLQPGEQSVWDVKDRSINVLNVSVMEVCSWKDGKIIFRNTPINDIAVALEKRYNARFVISPRLKDERFTGTFSNFQLVQILEHFKISSNIRYEIKGLDMNSDGTVNKTIVELK